MEFTFLQLEEQMMLAELLEDLRNVAAMVGQVLGVNEDIIYVNDHELMEELPEHLVHESLEDGWGVGNAERHTCSGQWG